MALSAARAASIAKAFDGRKAGNGWTARCPCMTIARRASRSGTRTTTRCWCAATPGATKSASSPRRATIERKPDHDDTKRTKAALAIWHSAKPSHGTPVETYLASRAICVPTPDALRFHPGLRHPSGGIWSVMAALVTSGTDGTPIAIHRTFLARDGAGKAPVDPPKMMFGPCRGGAVRLADPSDVLMVGEGIETCLAAMLATGYPAWAALSTSGLRGLDLPKDVRDLIVLADGDEAGDAAAEVCALRWKRQGRRVRIARPPRGMDFNEMLTGRAPFLEERPQ